MTFALLALIVTWLCGLLFLAGQHLNDIRLVLNNVAPEAQSSDQPLRPRLLPAAATSLPLSSSLQGFSLMAVTLLIWHYFRLDRFNVDRITSIDPALLTETGRVHLKRAVRNERILIACMLGGFVLLVSASAYSLAS